MICIGLFNNNIVSVKSNFTLDKPVIDIEYTIFEVNNYAFRSDIFNDDNYSITNVEQIKGKVVQYVNERIDEQNNGLYNRYVRDDEGQYDTNIKSTRHSRTSTEDARISTKQQEGINNKSNNQEIIRNSRKELEKIHFMNSVTIKYR